MCLCPRVNQDTENRVTADSLLSLLSPFSYEYYESFPFKTVNCQFKEKKKPVSKLNPSPVLPVLGPLRTKGLVCHFYSTKCSCPLSHPLKHGLTWT